VKGLREANLRYVQDVARCRARNAWNNVRNISDRNVRRGGNYERDWFDGLSAAAAGHAGRRTGGVITSGGLVACAGLIDDEAIDPGHAERQQADDDREGESPHSWILALGRDALSVATPVIGHSRSRKTGVGCAHGSSEAVRPRGNAGGYVRSRVLIARRSSIAR